MTQQEHNIMQANVAEQLDISVQQVKLMVDAWNYCDREDKSTEFMLQYIGDMSNVDFDTVMDFLQMYERIEFD